MAKKKYTVLLSEEKWIFSAGSKASALRRLEKRRPFLFIKADKQIDVFSKARPAEKRCSHSPNNGRRKALAPHEVIQIAECLDQMVEHGPRVVWHRRSATSAND